MAYRVCRRPPARRDGGEATAEAEGANIKEARKIISIPWNLVILRFSRAEFFRLLRCQKASALNLNTSSVLIALVIAT